MANPSNVIEREATETKPVASTESIEAKESQKPEKTFTRDELARISANSKNDGYEKGFKDAQAKIAAEMQSRAQPPVQQPNPYQQQAQQYPQQGMQMNQNDAQVEAAMQRLQKQAEDRAAVQSFFKKVDDAKLVDPEVGEHFKELQISDMEPNQATLRLVKSLNSVDNLGDVIKEIGNHPEKFANICQLASSPNPRLLEKSLKSLSDSIEQNRAAKSTPTAAEPMSQVKTSFTGTDNGSKTVRDLRRQPWLRG